LIAIPDFRMYNNYAPNPSVPKYVLNRFKKCTSFTDTYFRKCDEDVLIQELKHLLCGGVYRKKNVQTARPRIVLLLVQ